MGGGAGQGGGGIAGVGGGAVAGAGGGAVAGTGGGAVAGTGGGGVAGAGGGAIAGSGAAGSGGADDCALPSVDGGTTPASLPDNVVFLPNVTVSTLTGGATPGSMNGAADVATFNNPVGVALEPSGSLLVATFDDSKVRRVSAAAVTSTLTDQSGFRRPYGIGVFGGVIYVQTDANMNSQDGKGALWKIDAGSGVPTLVADNAGRLRAFGALSDGRLVLSDVENDRLRLYSPTAGQFTDLAGNPSCPGTAASEGTGTNARFAFPSGIAVLTGDRIIVADRTAHVLREVTLAGVVTTFAGDGGAGTIDGPRATARFMGPRAVTSDGTGAVYVSDDVAHRIRRIAADGTVTTVAGTGTGGFADGAGNVAAFWGQEGIAASADGSTLYVADGTSGDEPPGPYHRVRKITIAP
jgi:hypothetical protein